MSKTILIIEDNPMNLELTRDLLQAAGFSVLTAEAAEEGVQLARRVHPDLVLMDISLPGMDGLEATRALKADPLTGSIPVLALTAHAMKGDEERARDAGCVGYLTKPIDTRSFCQVVAGYLPGEKEDHARSN